MENPPAAGDPEPALAAAAAAAVAGRAAAYREPGAELASTGTAPPGWKARSALPPPSLEARTTCALAGLPQEEPEK